MRMSASWFGSWTHRIQGRGAIDPRPESGLPSDRHPDRTKRTVVLEAVKVWASKGGVCRKVGATANLDSSCARWLCNIAGRGEETGTPGRTKKPIKKERCVALKPLDKKGPIQGLLGVHSRYGLHTRAVTVYRDTLSEGFSHFVTSMTAPVASRWSGCRVGLAPTGKRRLVTAHATTGLMQCNKPAHLFDHLVGARKQHRRHVEAECLGSRMYVTLAADGRTANFKFTPDEPDVFAPIPNSWGRQG